MFDPSIPQPKDPLSVSQGDLLTNFTQLNTQFGVNHVAFDDAGANKGKHAFATFVEQAQDPESKSDEYLVYSKDDSGDTELYARPEANATAYQITKDGSLYTGLKPIVAVNFSNVSTYIQGSSLGVASITNPSTGTFQINFTAAVTAELADANYYWSVSGFTSTNIPCIAQVQDSVTYGDVVNTSRIIFDFKNAANTGIAITRACAICWRFQ